MQLISKASTTRAGSWPSLCLEGNIHRPADGHPWRQLLHCTLQLATAVQEHVIGADKDGLTALWQWHCSSKSEKHVRTALQLAISVHSLSLWQQARTTSH